MIKPIVLTISSFLFFFAVGCMSREESKVKTLEDVLASGRSMININDQVMTLSGNQLGDVSVFSQMKDYRAGIYQAMADKQWDLAISKARSFLQKFPGNLDAQLIIANANIAKQDYVQAQFFAELVLKTDPQNAAALNILGIVQWKTALIVEDYRQAVAYFNLSSQLSQKDFSPLLNLAYMQLRLGNLESAWTEFSNASKVCGGCEAARLGSAVAAQRLGKYEAALSDIEEVLNVNPGQPLALYLKSVHYREYLGDPGQAQGWAMKVIDSDQADYELQEKAREQVADY